MFDNNFNNSNNDFSFKPIFNQSDKEKLNLQSINSINNNESKDIPPELGEIRNLTESPQAQAPTLDVLSPMNVMPLNPINNNDILDSYEKGFDINQVNTLSNNMMNEVKEIQLPNVSQNNEYNFDNKFNNWNTKDDYNIYNNGLDSSNINETESTFEYQNVNETEPTFESQNINETESKIEYSNVNEPESKFEASNINEPELNKNYSIINNSLSGNTKNEDNIENTNKSINNERIKFQENDFSINKENLQEENIDYKKYYTNIFIPQKDESLNTSNEIIYESNEANQNVTDELLELGIDDVYSEPDTLEIIDIEPEEENIIEKEIISYNEAILQIKDLCEKVKEKNVKIELEEFDFEDMYQLIIKIDK